MVGVNPTNFLSTNARDDAPVVEASSRFWTVTLTVCVPFHALRSIPALASQLVVGSPV